MGMRVDVSGCCVVSVAHEVLYVFRLHVGPVEKSGERVSGRVRSKVPVFPAHAGVILYDGVIRDL